MSSTRWLGLDIGGANLKAAHSSGIARSVAFELWKRPNDLAKALRALIDSLPPADRVAVTMTAELCDCYETKAEGVASVLGAVASITAEEHVFVWGIDGRFHAHSAIRAEPHLAAASNWLALAEVAARLVPRGPGILIDIGSTTSDLIPILDGRPAPQGRTDTARLRSGELVYAGVRRTPVSALANELVWRELPTGLAAELFATTLDIYVTLGMLGEEPANCQTADGRRATRGFSRDRLARMVGADRTSFSEADAAELSHAAHTALIERLAASAKKACSALPAPPRAAIVSGAGVFLAKQLAEHMLEPGDPVLDLGAEWGRDAVVAACAHALTILASEIELIT